MNLVALMPVRNEDWVLGLSARVALRWCDQLVILDHASTDRTPGIIQELATEHPGRVISIRNENGLWDEMGHRQLLLETARKQMATHIAMVDADEILTANLVDRIRPIVKNLPRNSILELPGYNLRGLLTRYHANGIWGNRWFSVAFVDDPRLGWTGDRFHHRDPMGFPLQTWRHVGQGQGGIMHLWGLNERRLIAKHAAYKMIEAVRWPKKSRAEIDNLYSLAFDPSKAPQFDQTWRFADTPLTWFADYGPIIHHLHADAEPWQEQMCRELYVKHGPQAFAGLDLFGVCDPKPELVDA
jgi:glycosyltransferase involved in cell wall biosynthesis